MGYSRKGPNIMLFRALFAGYVRHTAEHIFLKGCEVRWETTDVTKDCQFQLKSCKMSQNFQLKQSASWEVYMWLQSHSFARKTMKLWTPITSSENKTPEATSETLDQNPNKPTVYGRKLSEKLSIRVVIHFLISLQANSALLPTIQLCSVWCGAGFLTDILYTSRIFFINYRECYTLSPP